MSRYINFHNDKGIVLLKVILVLLIMMVVLTSLISMTVTESKIASNDKHAAQAFYLAEAGIWLAVDYLYLNDTFKGELLLQSGFSHPQILGEGQINSILISVVEEGPPKNVKVRSEGEVREVKKAVEVILEITSPTAIRFLNWKQVR